MKEKEKTASEDIEDVKEANKKRHLNVVFIGHVGRLTFYFLFFALVFIMSYPLLSMMYGCIISFILVSFLLCGLSNIST